MDNINIKLQQFIYNKNKPFLDENEWNAYFKAVKTNNTTELYIATIMYLSAHELFVLKKSPFINFYHFSVILKGFLSKGKEITKYLYSNKKNTTGLLDVYTNLMSLMIYFHDKNNFPNNLIESKETLNNIENQNKEFCKFLFLVASQSDEVSDIVTDIKDTIYNIFLQIESALIAHIDKLSLELIEVTERKTERIVDWDYRPTIKWLIDPDFVNAVHSVDLKSSENYSENLYQLWKMLTFYCGSSTFFPKCEALSHGKSCGLPVIHSTKGKEAWCSTSECPNLASYRCCMTHNYFMCMKCIENKQKDLLGSKSKKASTDVYDCLVDKIFYQQGLTLHCSELVCRNPPKSIRWKSTYRLQNPNLVGIVLLDKENDKIDLNQRIIWAEVTSMKMEEEITLIHGLNEEKVKSPLKTFQEREAKKIGLRILNQADATTLKFNYDDRIIQGSHIAIIDFRVFCPEVFSVLGIFSDPTYSHRISNTPLFRFINRKIEGFPKPLDIKNSRDIRLSYAVEHSTIPMIKKLPKDFKIKLFADIRDKDIIVSLDDTQFDSLSTSLMTEIHLTQGPPGTGKTYLCTCLAYCLVIARRYYNSQFKSGKLGPVLVLSYKNRTVDQALISIYNSRPSDFNMIRMGQTDNEILEPFHDKITRDEKNLFNEFSKKVQLLNNSRDYWGEMFKYYNRSLGYTKPTKEILYKALYLLNSCSSFKSLSDISPDKALQILSKDYSDNDRTVFFPILTLLKQLQQGKNMKDLSFENCMELLKIWLNDSIPNDLCKGNNGKCFARTGSKFVMYCNKHRCSFHNCKNGNNEDSLYCPSHTCSKCKEGVIGDSFKFCKSHICNCCYINEAIYIPKKEEESIPTCEEHKCKAINCTNASIGKVFPYCKKHTCIVCYKSKELQDLSICSSGFNICDNHKCSVDGCKTQKFESSTLYCSRHGCHFCDNPIEKFNNKSKYQVCNDHKCNNEECFNKSVCYPDGSIVGLCQNHCGKLKYLELEKPKLHNFQSYTPDCYLIKCKECNNFLCTEDKEAPLFCNFHIELNSKLFQHFSNTTDAPIDEIEEKEEEFIEIHDKKNKTLKKGTILQKSLVDNEEFSNIQSNVNENIFEEEENNFIELIFEKINEDTDLVIESKQLNPDNFKVNENEYYDYGDEFVSSEDIKKKVEELKEWTWTGVKDVNATVFELVHFACKLYKRIQVLILKEFEDIKLELKYLQYLRFNNVDLVGGTVVSATKRFEAFVKLKPSAIILEEAGETMESTLVSLLSVPSIQKVELIGDHRQLPAVINNNWFHLALVNKEIKRSLFENLFNFQDFRIITILSIQRRMKPEISILTKDEYIDLVQILDHSSAVDRKLGDKVTPKWFDKDKFHEIWGNKGVSVPCTPSRVYFWNVPNSQQVEASNGRSDTNQVEATAVVNFIKFLKSSGIPLQSITVLTPYNAQCKLLNEYLNNRIPEQRVANDKRRMARRNLESNFLYSGVYVSTIDRFQGDENDIIITSLVKTVPNNTFLLSKERFIVNSSRARIAFYIFGNLKAIGRPILSKEKKYIGFDTEKFPHWGKFLRKLNIYQQVPSKPVLVGDEFPICCPAHPTSILKVGKTIDSTREQKFPTHHTWSHLCSVRCAEKLICNHNCNLPCHYLNRNEHNKECKETLKRNCQYHSDIPVFCYEVANFSKQSRGMFKCNIEVNIPHPVCGHDCKVLCQNRNDVSKINCEYKKNEYKFPTCEHVIKDLSCRELEKYKSKPPFCQKMVTLDLPCGHQQKIKCYEQLYNNLNFFSERCEVAITTRFTRCGHNVSLSCSQNREISTKNFSYLFQNDAKQISSIELGEAYDENPVDILDNHFINGFNQCMKKVSVNKICGHLYKHFYCHEAYDVCNNYFERNFNNNCKKSFSSIPNFLESENDHNFCEENLQVSCFFCDSTKLMVRCSQNNVFLELLDKSIIKGEELVIDNDPTIPGNKWKDNKIKIKKISFSNLVLNYQNNKNFNLLNLKSFQCSCHIQVKFKCCSEIISTTQLLKILINQENKTIDEFYCYKCDKS